MRLVESYMNDGPGVLILQDPNFAARGISPSRPDRRACMLAVRIKGVQIGGDGIGHYEYDQEGNCQIGDVVGSLFWPAASRPIPGVSFAWPAVMGPGQGGGSSTNGDGAGGSPGAGASFTDPPMGPDANSGNYGFAPSGNTGVGNTYGDGGGGAGFVFGDPAAQPDANSGTYGFAPVNPQPGQPGGPGGPDGNGAPGAPPGGQPEPVATEGGRNTCGNMPLSLAQMLPVGLDWEADSRYKPVRAYMPDLWPKFPKNTYGIALPASDETQQQELFFPICPHLMAINKAGDPKIGSMVADATEKFEIDKDRITRLQSMMWVLKKPMGSENAIGWNLNESGCQDVVGGFVVDKPNGGSPGGGGVPGGTPTPGGGSDGGGSTPGTPSPAPPSGAGSTQTDGDGKERVIGRMSVHHGGPLDVGSGKCKHVVGADDDGNKISKCHITTKALFRRNDSEDGPIEFDGPYPHPDKQPFFVQAFLGWDSGAQMWRFWAEAPMQMSLPRFGDITPLTIRDQPTVPNFPTRPNFGNIGDIPGGVVNTNAANATQPTVRDDPSNAGGAAGQGTPFQGGETDSNTYDGPVPGSTPTTTGESQQQQNAQDDQSPVASIGNTSNQTQQGLVATPMALGAAQFAATAQDYTAGKPDNRNNNQASMTGNMNNVPVSGMMSAFSAQGGQASQGYGSGNNNIPGAGDPHVYTQRPDEGKFRGGTTSGGWVIHPPETGPEDADKYGMVPPSITLSSTYMVVAPGAFFGAGIPSFANGGIKDGFVWKMDSATGDLVFSGVYQSAPPVESIRFVLSSGNIQWRSNNLVAGFYGEFEHGNTGNRIYTFPDRTGPMAMMLTGSGSPAGSVSAPESTMYWDVTANVLYVNNDGATAWTAVGAAGVTGSGAAGQVTYWTGASTVAGDAGLTYDAALDQLTISSASTPLQVNTTALTAVYGFTSNAAFSTSNVIDWLFQFKNNAPSTVTMEAIEFGSPGVSAAAEIGSMDFHVIDAGTLASRLKIRGGNVGVNTALPRRKFDVLDTSNPQIRATYTDNTVYTDLKTDSSGYFFITPTGTNLYLQKSVGGGLLSFQIHNQSNTASSQANLHILTGGASAHDPMVNWSVDGVTTWTAGIDNSDSDTWKVSSGANLGTNDFLTILTDGSVGVGGGAVVEARLQVSGTVNPTSRGYGVIISTTVNAAENQGAYGLRVAPTLVEFSSGTHGDFATAWFSAPTITAGAAALTTTANVYANGRATAGTRNYVGWFVASDSSTDPMLHVDQASTGDAAIRFQRTTNARSFILGIDATDDLFKVAYASSNAILGTGDYFGISSAGNVVLNNAALTTSATDGFLYIATCAGAPSGVPTSYTGRMPIIIDTTNNAFYFYSTGSWRTPSGGGGTLDAAYDFGGAGAGRTITVDTGAVTLTGGGTTVGGFTVNGSRTIASAAGAVWNEVLIDADVSLSGSTDVTTATGFNMVTFNAPTITDAGTITSITNSSTVYIGGAPTGSGLSLTNAYGFWLDSGNARFDGNIFLSTGAFVGETTSGTGIQFTTASTGYQLWLNTAAASSGAVTQILVRTGASTGQTAGSEVLDVDFDLDADLRHASNTTVATQRCFLIRPRTYSFASASGTITVGAGLAIVGSPTSGSNCTQTTSLAFWVAAGGTGSFNTYFGATPSMGGGIGAIGIANAGTNPSSNPTGGGVMYANAGAGTWRGSGGTVTAFGPAGPHCGKCGMDMWTVASINPEWKAWCYECGYCGAVYKGGPQDVLGRLNDQQKKELLFAGMGWAEVSRAVGVAA